MKILMKSKKHTKIILAGTSVLIVFLYVFTASRQTGMGFPLDDAWIHQTYARNLVHYGNWVYVPGNVSAGSTAPLWTLLLSIGYLFSDFAFGWTIVLGAFFLFLTSYTFENAIRKSFPMTAALPFAGLFLLFEWHMGWAAASGMETILAAFLVMFILSNFVLETRRSFWAGILCGLAVWVRPDLISLLGPLIFTIWLRPQSLTIKIKNTYLLILGSLVFIVPYLGLNYSLSGNILPNTFFAKQTEYKILLDSPVFERIIDVFRLPLIGPGILLLPGFLYLSVQSVKTKNWPMISLFLWLIGFLAIYALRLPVVYQHGRYIMPAMPVYFFLGLLGSLQFVQQSMISQKYKRVLKFFSISVFSLTTLSFMVIGINAFAEDVAIINTEMVQSAQWISKNTDKGSVIAAHDIGALGFFADRKIVDLAGLISPEVIPFIRDEVKLADYLDQNNVDYVVVFPGWYRSLLTDKILVYTTDSLFSPQVGGENMAIYLWKTR